MKHKAVLGCLAVVVLLGAGAAAAGYAGYRKVRSGIDRFAELRSVPELERSVRNQSTFTPPSSGELTRGQVERLLEVQRAVRVRLGDRVGELERKYRTYLERKEHTAAELPALVSAYGDLAAAYVDGKRAQVAALDQVGFSVAEYRWVREKAYAALDLRLVDIDIVRLLDEERSGPTRLELAPPADSSGLRANIEMVAPHRKAIEDYLGLAFLGL